jgi:hypothetical protein
LVYNSQVRQSTADVGTSQGDTILLVNFIDEQACRQINRGLGNADTIPSFATSGSADRDAGIMLNDGSFSVGSAFNSIIDVGGPLPGCYFDSGSGVYFYAHMMREN